MRRTKIQSRGEKRRFFTKWGNERRNELTDKEIYKKIFQSDVSISEHDVMFENEPPYKTLSKMFLASNIEEAKETLKNLSHIMKKEDNKNRFYDENIMNVVDPTLDYRFLNRQSLRDFNLPKIRTRLKWQKGEFPFFKIDVRHYTKDRVPYKNRRALNRYIKSFVIQDLLTGDYQEIPFPEEEWPHKGILYLTNHRLFFKKNSKSNFEIPFENIVSYHFYQNGIYVEYMQCNEKITEVFFVDPDQARLLETMIKTTL